MVNKARWENVAGGFPSLAHIGTLGAQQLGVGTRMGLPTTPIPIKGDHHFVAFGGGQDYVCAVEGSGAAYCWGEGRLGQLGSGEMAP